MKKEEVTKLVKLRTHAVEFYRKLESPNLSTSVMQTKDTAFFCEQMISSIDSLLKDYVKFE